MTDFDKKNRDAIRKGYLLPMGAWINGVCDKTWKHSLSRVWSRTHSHFKSISQPKLIAVRYFERSLSHSNTNVGQYHSISRFCDGEAIYEDNKVWNFSRSRSRRSARDY